MFLNTVIYSILKFDRNRPGKLQAKLLKKFVLKNFAPNKMSEEKQRHVKIGHLKNSTFLFSNPHETW